MLLPALLTLLLAAPAEPRITIYVGPPVRDGFVDADQGVWDSIYDVRKRLRKDKTITVVDDESAAVVKVYVLTRGTGPTTGDGIVIHSPGTVLKWANGQTTTMPGTSFHFAAKSRHIAAVLRVGTYERAFVAEDAEYDTWKRCAQNLVTDVSAWLVSNRERLTAEELAR